MSSSSPHVLFIGDKFGYPGGVAHGDTTYFLQVLPALAEAGVEVTSCFLREAHPLAEPLFAQGLDLLLSHLVSTETPSRSQLAKIFAAAGRSREYAEFRLGSRHELHRITSRGDH